MNDFVQVTSAEVSMGSFVNFTKDSVTVASNEAFVDAVVEALVEVASMKASCNILWTLSRKLSG